MKVNFDIRKFLNFGKLFKKKGAADDPAHTLAMPDFGDTEEFATADSDSITLESDAPAEKIKIKLKKPGDPDRGRKLKLVLVLVLLLGGGYYVISNDLVDAEPVMDSVMGLAQPVLEMAGLAEPPAPPAPAPKPRARKQTAKAPASRTKPAEATTSKPADTPKAAVARTKPVRGTVDGKTFEPGHIEYRRGELVLREGTASAPKTEIKLAVPHDDWELPASKTFETGLFKSAEVTLLIEGSQSQVVSKGVDMEIRFGTVENGMLSGDIKLASKQHQLQVEGAFKAAVSGFHTINGEPVLTGDANETLMFVALKHLLKKEPEKAISNVAYRDTRFTPVNKPRSGSLVMEYAINNKEVSRSFEFKKTSTGWQVSRMSAEK